MRHLVSFYGTTHKTTSGLIQYYCWFFIEVQSLTNCQNDFLFNFYERNCPYGYLKFGTNQ